MNFNREKITKLETNLIELNNEFSLGLNIKKIKEILTLTEEELNKISNVPKGMFELYKTELKIKKVFIFYVNSKLSKRDYLSLNNLSQSRLKINLVIARDLNDKILMDSLKCLLSLQIGYTISNDNFSTKLYKVFNFN